MGVHENRVFPIKLGAVCLNTKLKMGYEKILLLQKEGKQKEDSG
jgi:hypothetical protein